jgi:general secretion pathway protein C
MGSALSWGANVILFVTGCFLAANTANAILSSVVLSPPAQTGEQIAPPPLRNGTWADRQIILSRNLFNASTLELTPPTSEIVEDIEATQLPLTLLGTAAASNPQFSWAAIEDRDTRETLVVSVGDPVKGNATVQRIERRRVVLIENGVPRELVLESDPGSTQAAPTVRSRRTSARNEKRSSARKRARKQPTKSAARSPGAGRSVAGSILSQARLLPKWENGELLGVEVTAIKSGTLLEEVGFEDGDIISEVNGTPINSPDQSAMLIEEFTSSANVISATVERGGQRLTLEFEIPE